MKAVWQICDLVVFLFLILLIGRFVLELVQSFARDWRPRGIVLVLAEIVYTVTDPPLRLIRRLIPPIRLGGFALDLGLLILFILTTVLLSVFGSLSRA
ncbi:MAG: YggT family protein [Actinomycetales bacterium]